VSAYTLVESVNTKDYCTVYFMITITDGVITNFLSLTFLAVVQNLFNNWKSLKFTSGNYSQVSTTSSWLYQLLIWIVICIISKMIMSIITIVCEIPLFFAASMLLLPFRWNQNLETLIILVLLPTVANILVLWIMDEFLMDPNQVYFHHSHVKKSRSIHTGQTHSKSTYNSQNMEPMNYMERISVEPLLEDNQS